MDQNFVWECDYWHRKKVKEVLKKLLKEQNADSLQMAMLAINNLPYNAELFVVLSYKEPLKGHIEEMKKSMNSIDARYRTDIVTMDIFQAIGDRRFNTINLNENNVELAFESMFFFPEKVQYEKNGYNIKNLGRHKRVFISHSSNDKKNIRLLLPYLNNNGLNLWYDEFDISVGENIVDKVQDGILQSFAVIFWITQSFLDSKWCRTEMKTFLGRSIDGDVRIISIIDEKISHRDLPLFLQHIKYLKASLIENTNISDISSEIISVLKRK